MTGGLLRPERPNRQPEHRRENPPPAPGHEQDPQPDKSEMNSGARCKWQRKSICREQGPQAHRLSFLVGPGSAYEAIVARAEGTLAPDFGDSRYGAELPRDHRVPDGRCHGRPSRDQRRQGRGGDSR